MPHAIRTWWHPGDTIGYEFLYPAAQARLLARGSGTPVRSIETLVPHWTEPEWTPPTFFETEPIPEAVTEAPVEGTAIAAPEAAVEPEAAPVEALPTTSSPLTMALTTAIALVAFAAAVELFAVRKRT